jgi:hypothetical protein
MARTRTARLWPTRTLATAPAPSPTPRSSREFYRIGLSANTTGVSVYVLGLDDKTYLARTYGGSIGKASVTGYCIKFRHLAVINVDVLQAAIQYGMGFHRAR